MDIERNARIARLVALLGFVLPWVTVSCAGHPIMRVSGINMATGKLTIHNPITGGTSIQSQNPDVVVLMALIVIIICTIIPFILKNVYHPLANAIFSGGALASISWEMLNDINKIYNKSGQNGVSAYPFEINISFGFWLTCLALACAIILDCRIWADHEKMISYRDQTRPPLW